MSLFPFVSGCILADLERFAQGKPLEGDIVPGEILAWEPLIRTAAQLVVVTKIDGYVWCCDIEGDREYYNDESRMREACVRTWLKPHPVKRFTGLVPPLPGLSIS